MKNTIYKNEKINNLCKTRAEELLKYYSGKLSLNKNEGVWMVLRVLSLDEQTPIMITTNYFEEVVGFEVVMVLPSHLNNQTFKKKVDKKGEFRILDSYNARVQIVTKDENNTKYLVTQIAYVFKDKDKSDLYDINKVKDILNYIETEIKEGFKECIDKYNIV